MDFSWFLTIPGMLITGGVLLLIIALIIFITTSSKKTKEKDSLENPSSMPNPVNDMGVNPVTNSQVDSSVLNSNVLPTDMNMGQMTTPSLEINQGDLSQSSQEVPTGIALPIENTQQQEVSSLPSTPEVQDSSSMNSTTGVAPTTPPIDSSISFVNDSNSATPPVMSNTTNAFETPPVEVAPVVENSSILNKEDPQMVEPSIQNVAVTPVEVAPSLETMQQPSIQAVETPVVQPVESTVSVQEVSPVNDTPQVLPVVEETAVRPDLPKAPIYGGADPSVSVAKDEANSHQIYGGANPLENTQVIPVQQAVVEPVVEQAPITNSPAVVPVDSSGQTSEVVAGSSTMPNS